MTDEPNKAGRVRQSVTAALLVALLLVSALAFLVGRKTAPQKAGYLYTDDNTVMFIEWKQTGRKIEAAMEGWSGSVGYQPQFEMGKYDVVLDREKVNMTVSYSADYYASPLTGTLRGDTLEIPFGDGSKSIKFRRATFTEYVDAYRNLYMRITPKQPPPGGPKPPPNQNPTKQGN
jgi:hypothetical protein